VLAANGQRIAQVRQADRELKLTIDKKVPASFANFLVEQLPHLFNTFSKLDGRTETTEA
jgi:ParB family chromosome partitioning protein